VKAHPFAAELARWGPQATYPSPGVDAAEAYCRQLARSHYENFTVVSWFLPRHLRQHFYNVYAYCRWADDLADETGGGQTALDLLSWWGVELDAMYAGQTRHPVFVALSRTVGEFEIPRQPLADLLVAFRQDQIKARYETFDELHDYCRHSANPVGRLVLHLGRSVDEVNVRLSDHICTGLQLANFWQDVARDWQRGRVYLPQADCLKFGCVVERASARSTPEFKRLLEFEVARAEEFLLAGRPLIGRIARQLRFEVDLFMRGGLAVLSAIRRQDYDVWSRRPTIGKLQKLGLVLRSWSSCWGSRFNVSAAEQVRKETR
jgi:squalene synthase HpnC